MSCFDENRVANRIAPDWTAHFAASHLGLLCLQGRKAYMVLKRTRDLWVFFRINKE